MKIERNIMTVILLALLALAVGYGIACDSSDDDDNDADDDDTFDADDDDDDEIDDDDTDDDDTGDDDTITSSSPFIYDGYWDPEETILLNMSSVYWGSWLVFSVYDPDNDLLEDESRYYLYDNLSGDLYDEDKLSLKCNGWGGLIDVDDSDNPGQAKCRIYFGKENEPEPAGLYCFDVRITDNAGNLSNPMTNVCVNHNPE